MTTKKTIRISYIGAILIIASAAIAFVSTSSDWRVFKPVVIVSSDSEKETSSELAKITEISGEWELTVAADHPDLRRVFQPPGIGTMTLKRKGSLYHGVFEINGKRFPIIGGVAVSDGISFSMVIPNLYGDQSAWIGFDGTLDNKSERRFRDNRFFAKGTFECFGSGPRFENDRRVIETGHWWAKSRSLSETLLDVKSDIKGTETNGAVK